MEITIPLYPEEIQITKGGRMATYFTKTDNLPKRYQDDSRFVWKERKVGRESRGQCLFDLDIDKFVVKNAVAASRPRFQAIAGNEFYPGLNEHVRMKIVEFLKAEFQKNFPKSLELAYPIRIRTCEVHTLPRRMNWDMDNMWIYTKCFQDALVDHGLIFTTEEYEKKDGTKGWKKVCQNPGAGLLANDNILYVTESPSSRFVPVTKETDRKLVYFLEEDTDPRVVNHLMYNCKPIPISISKEIIGYAMYPSKACKLGDISLDVDKESFFVNTGGKSSEKHKGECFKKVYHQCVQMNIRQITTTSDMAGNALKAELADKGVQIYILE